MHDSSRDPIVAAPASTELRMPSLLRQGKATPRFLQGVYPFVGRGIFDALPLNEALSYTVPVGKIAQLVYFRAGNASDDLIYLTLTANDTPIRYFPVGPKADIHVPLVIVEVHPAGTKLDIGHAAPRGLAGTVILDIGLLEMDEDVAMAGA